ncbi:hypothetical protein BO443_60082 [Burkholderia orbicola]
MQYLSIFRQKQTNSYPEKLA